MSNETEKAVKKTIRKTQEQNVMRPWEVSPFTALASMISVRGWEFRPFETLKLAIETRKEARKKLEEMGE